VTAAPSGPHTAAVLARLQATLPAEVTVYDGTIPPGTPPQTYVVLYPGAPTRARSSMSVDAPDLTTRPQVTCVGVTREQAEAIADAVASTLIGWRPTITGRSCDPIFAETAQPATRDDAHREPATDQPRWYAVEIVRLHSVAA
jgi:hypothetical protein